MKNRSGDVVYLDDISFAVMSADGTDLEDILRLVKHRYEQLFPNWEIHMISLEKGENRARQIDSMIAILERLKMVN